MTLFKEEIQSILNIVSNRLKGVKLSQIEDLIDSLAAKKTGFNKGNTVKLIREITGGYYDLRAVTKTVDHIWENYSIENKE